MKFIYNLLNILQNSSAKLGRRHPFSFDILQFYCTTSNLDSPAISSFTGNSCNKSETLCNSQVLGKTSIFVIVKTSVVCRRLVDQYVILVDARFSGK